MRRKAYLPSGTDAMVQRWRREGRAGGPAGLKLSSLARMNACILEFDFWTYPKNTPTPESSASGGHGTSFVVLAALLGLRAALL